MIYAFSYCLLLISESLITFKYFVEDIKVGYELSVSWPYAKSEVISDAHSLTLGQILNKYKNVRIVQINFVVVEEEEEEEKQAYDINKMVST